MMKDALIASSDSFWSQIERVPMKGDKGVSSCRDICDWWIPLNFFTN